MAAYLLITIATFFFMEFVAWFTHKYIMHGFLWTLHEDHHLKDSGFFEKNDTFFLIFAVPSFFGLLVGIQQEIYWLACIGSGIALYGVAYFFVHDLFIHQRLKILRRTKSPYLKALRRAHKIHHKNLGREKGECFGMLVVPYKYWLEAKKIKK